MTDDDLSPVRKREWIAELLERAEMVEWDRFVVQEYDDTQCVVVYGWIDRDVDEYKDFVLTRFWTSQETLEFTTSSDRYSEELHCLWFGEDDLDDHNPCRRVEDTFDVENAIELGEQTTLTDGGTERSVTDPEKPLGMSGVAWKGCTCSACRGERRRYLGRPDLPADQATLADTGRER